MELTQGSLREVVHHIAKLLHRRLVTLNGHLYGRKLFLVAVPFLFIGGYGLVEQGHILDNLLLPFVEQFQSLLWCRGITGDCDIVVIIIVSHRVCAVRE